MSTFRTALVFVHEIFAVTIFWSLPENVGYPPALLDERLDALAKH